MKKCNNEFPFKIGIIPTSYLMSLTYEEQIIWICNYIEKNIIEKINNIESKLDNWEEIVKELEEKISLIDNLLIEFEQLKIDIEKEIDDEITRLSLEIKNKINTELNKIYIYIDEIERRIDYKIDNISLDNFKMVNPLTGNLDSVNNLIYILFDQLRADPITAGEFDSLQLTCNVFESKDLTAFEFDNNGKALLM